MLSERAKNQAKKRASSKGSEGGCVRWEAFYKANVSFIGVDK